MKKQMKIRFKKQVALDARKKNVLESLRFQDNDLSLKLGSTLAFSGLMIATSIVLLSTSEGAILHIDRTDLFLLNLNSVGLILLYASGISTIISLVLTTDYPEDAEQALIQYDDYLKKKKRRLNLSSKLLLGGTLSIMIALVVILVKNILG